MTLRKKILVGYLAIVVILAVMVAWAVTDFKLLGGATEEILRENYHSIVAADAMIKHLERQDSATLLLLVEGREAAQVQFHDNQSEFLRWLARAEDNITIAGEKEVVEEIDAAYSKYLMAYAEVTGANSENAGAQQLYRDELLPLFEQVRDACTRLRTMNHETMVAESAKTKLMSKASLSRIAWLAGITIGVGALLSLLLAELLTHPLQEMMLATSMIAAGRYDVSIQADTKDELGELARRFKTMSAKLKGFHDLNVGRLMEERKRLEAVLRSIADGVVVMDDRLRVVLLNPAASAIFGVWPDDVKGRPVVGLLNDETLHESIEGTASSGRGSLERGEIRLTREDKAGHARHYRCASTPVVTEDGATLGVVLVLQDLTRLLEADRLKNEFIMAASHELRTPLTGMVMSLKLLGERLAPKADDEERELLETADEEARRLRALVEDLLDLSKITSGRLQLEARRTSVADLVEPALISIRAQIEAKGVSLTTWLPESLPEVATDPQKVAWVVANLLSNAMRYTDAGGEITISARKVGDAVHLSVKDSGPGIPAEHQARIFDPFVQVRTEGHAQGGLGIGLTLARSIVHAQGGTIWVESSPGEGSTFSFTMPLWSTATGRDPAGSA
jgi:NtrC-family two-component system sensor histidine kinase KinB